MNKNPELTHGENNLRGSEIGNRQGKFTGSWAGSWLKNPRIKANWESDTRLHW